MYDLASIVQCKPGCTCADPSARFIVKASEQEASKDLALSRCNLPMQSMLNSARVVGECHTMIVLRTNCSNCTSLWCAREKI